MAEEAKTWLESQPELKELQDQHEDAILGQGVGQLSWMQRLI